MTVKITPNDEFVTDVLITAIEGGIGYWSEVKSYNPDECKARIREEGKTWDIDASVIRHGIDLIASDEVKFLGSRCRKDIIAAAAMDDAGDIDAPLADIIIQAALFGEIVYG